jgi:peptide-methionine (R)-S-oxide reductase
MKRSEREWKKLLSPEQYQVLREKATEIPFTGEYLYNEQDGTYRCAACGMPLFLSDTKFKTDFGWPSFYNVIDNKAVRLKEDVSLGLHRVELTCAKRGSHLGHVFNDAPEQPTGMRFCINSIALNFKPDKAKENK